MGVCGLGKGGSNSRRFRRVPSMARTDARVSGIGLLWGGDTRPATHHTSVDCRGASLRTDGAAERERGTGVVPATYSMHTSVFTSVNRPDEPVLFALAERDFSPGHRMIKPLSYVAGEPTSDRIG